MGTQDGGQGKKSERAQRQAEALRANLRRRKAQVRERDDAGTGADEGGDSKDNGDGPACSED